MDQQSLLPVRQRNGETWEVLLVDNDCWVKCETESDARKIARVRLYEHESLQRTRDGIAFAEELEQLADALERCRIGFGSRFFRRRAEEVRGNQS